MIAGSAENGMLYNGPNVGNGLSLLRALKTGIVPCVFFDPQYRGLLDQMEYGNEGAKQGLRAALPQMGAESISRFLVEIERVLRPGRYCFMWLDKFSVSEGLYPVPGLQRVDLITWVKPRIGNGYRTRRKCEYLRVLQKPPIEAASTWSDRGIPDAWGPEPGEGGHPHAKPFELQRSLIAATTQPRDWVIDPCAGGYSVMRAAHACGRQFFGCDLREWPDAEARTKIPMEGASTRDRDYS